MKKFVSLLLIFALTLGGFVGFNRAEAAETDTFNITITCQYIEITLKQTDESTSYDTWAIGTVATSSDNEMAAGDGIYVDRGTTSINIDLQGKVTTDATDWSIGGSAGADTYALKGEGTIGSGAVDFSSATALDASEYKDIHDATDVSANHWLYFELLAPTSTTTGSEQTITVTIKATGTS
jgi:hypothetical protein